MERKNLQAFYEDRSKLYDHWASNILEFMNTANTDIPEDDRLDVMEFNLVLEMVMTRLKSHIAATNYTTYMSKKPEINK